MRAGGSYVKDPETGETKLVKRGGERKPSAGTKDAKANKPAQKKAPATKPAGKQEG